MMRWSHAGAPRLSAGIAGALAAAWSKVVAPSWSAVTAPDDAGDGSARRTNGWTRNSASYSVTQKLY
jgi:hypothetical protein